MKRKKDNGKMTLCFRGLSQSSDTTERDIEESGEKEINESNRDHKIQWHHQYQ